jgi:hypothetical protein
MLATYVDKPGRTRAPEPPGRRTTPGGTGATPTDERSQRHRPKGDMVAALHHGGNDQPKAGSLREKPLCAYAGLVRHREGTQPVGSSSADAAVRNGVLYLIISGAPAPEGIPELVTQCRNAGWRVVVFSTPLGVRFTDPAELERLTGEPVRSDYRMPGTGKTLPSANAVLACPLTFNSVNKFAHGHADNFAIGLLCELLGYGVPITVVPHCKPQLASHPAFGASIATLRGAGVNVLFDPAAPYERRLPAWRDVVAALSIQAEAR